MTEIISQETIDTNELNALINETELNSNLHIPENSDTILIKDSTSRFSGAEWFDTVKDFKITIAGIGGIGSWTALLISRLSPAIIRLYDDDVVEEGNLSGQLFSVHDIRAPKVSAIRDTIRDFSGYYSLSCHAERISSTSGVLMSNIAICGFDNMEARKEFYYLWKERAKTLISTKAALYIDGRLNAEEFQIICIRGDDEYSMKLYEEKYLFEDSEAESPICSYKQTTFCASMIASFISNLVVNHAANLNEDISGRDLPFFTYYNAAYMYLKTE